MIPLELLRLLEDTNQSFTLSRVAIEHSQYRWFCHVGDKRGDNSVSSFGPSASEVVSEVVSKLKKSSAIPSDLNHSWCLP